MSSQSALSDSSLVIVFATAPTGLGHLRVTEALYHGLPEGASAILLGAQDRSLGALYRFVSIHPITRSIMEWMQHGYPERLFTAGYRYFLRSPNTLLLQQLTTILDERMHVPTSVLVIATHFALAHQLAAIKQTLVRKTGVRMLLVVQVTDDSPQAIWYVKGADAIFVPSEKTKRALARYSKHVQGNKPEFFTVPYPVTPLFAATLHPNALDQRVRQTVPTSTASIHMAIPVSGAAVSTDFIRSLISRLHQTSQRFVFHIIVKEALFTKKFISDVKHKKYAHVITSSHDRGIVDAYEQLYVETPPTFEITKPSEQAFKALLSPKQRGGSILLFSNPVGKQEYDNLDFLKRHYLIPNDEQQAWLWQLAEHKTVLAPKEEKTLFEVSRSWRGLLLPNTHQKAADFIIWCLANDLFAAMVTRYQKNNTDTRREEVSPQGVKEFWGTVDELVEKHYPK